MKLPLNLRFIGLEPSKAVESAVHARIVQLERLWPEVMSWRVTVRQEYGHPTQGRPFSVHVELTMRLQDVAFFRMHEDVSLALRDAFDAARQKLDELVRIRRGDVEHHGA
jgi:hypothetical protein